MPRVTKKINISDAEWEVMRVVWANGSCTSKKIIDVLSKKMGWKPATIKTLIGRLVKKKHLTSRQEGNRYIYSTDTNEPESLQAEVDAVLDQICKRKVANLISYMIDQATFSPENKEKLIAQLMEKDAVEKVPCTCFPGQCTCHLHRENTILSDSKEK